jgi:hypothetical protein
VGVARFLRYKVTVLDPPDRPERPNRTFYRAQHARSYINDLREQLEDDEPGPYLHIAGENLKGWAPLTELDLAIQSDREF